MVASQIEARQIKDPRLLAAMRKIPRHKFIPRIDGISPTMTGRC